MVYNFEAEDMEGWPRLGIFSPVCKLASLLASL